MFKYFNFSVLFLLLAGNVCAAPVKTSATPRCKAKTEKKTIKATTAGRDDFKAKYWIIASIFRQ